MCAITNVYFHLKSVNRDYDFYVFDTSGSSLQVGEKVGFKKVRKSWCTIIAKLLSHAF